MRETEFLEQLEEEFETNLSGQNQKSIDALQTKINTIRSHCGVSRDDWMKCQEMIKGINYEPVAEQHMARLNRVVIRDVEL